MRPLLWGVVISAVVALGACAPSSPDVPLGADGRPDPVLAQGRGIYQASCVQCHGGDGGGGRGPQLNGGVVVEKYPDIGDQIAVVTNGKGEMQAFGERLGAAEIDAVVRYTREVLNEIE